MRFSTTYTQAKSGFGQKMCLSRDHLANVRVVISDAKLITDNGTANVIDNADAFTPEVLSYSDPYPFGQNMPGRNWSATIYRYGMNTQEKDNEIFTGAYGAEYWEYDSRIGRRWNVDPVFKPRESRHATFANNPIWFNDILGDDINPKASGYEEARKAATPEFKKNIWGKLKQVNNDYEPEFAKIWQSFENNHDIMVSFEHKEGAGSIEFTGVENNQKMLIAHWDPKQTKELGASGLFEESRHLWEAIEGKEQAFPENPNSGVMGVDINDEVRVKIWVARSAEFVILRLD